jgi:hypothetical protein
MLTQRPAPCATPLWRQVPRKVWVQGLPLWALSAISNPRPLYPSIPDAVAAATQRVVLCHFETWIIGGAARTRCQKPDISVMVGKNAIA